MDGFSSFTELLDFVILPVIQSCMVFFQGLKSRFFLEIWTFNLSQFFPQKTA